MGFFKKRKVEEPENDYLDTLDIAGLEEKAVDIQPEPMQTQTLEQKKQTIENCCDRITSSNSRINELKVEYQAVNSYLTDIQLIEDLPETNAKQLLLCAKKVAVLDKDRRDFGRAMSKLSDGQFNHIRENEDEITEILKQMSEDEKYCETVKTDMKYLEAEKNGLKFEIQHLKNILYLLNGFSKIGIIVFMVLMILFLILNYTYGKDTSMLIYILVGITAIFAAVIYLMYNDTTNELKIAEIKQNRVIGLLNKVKIKYVNVAGRLTYAYEKHGVKSSYQLGKVWGAYLTQKKEHEVYNRASARLIDSEEELLKLLKDAGVKDTSVWLNQVYALIDDKEMNEMKSHLIKRRNKLKSSLDYNTDIIEKAREEIKNIIINDKENAKILMGILDVYEERM